MDFLPLPRIDGHALRRKWHVARFDWRGCAVGVIKCRAVVVGPAFFVAVVSLAYTFWCIFFRRRPSEPEATLWRRRIFGCLLIFALYVYFVLW